MNGGGYKGCEPESKVVFLKTHKCASSTLQNMLFRYARQNDLNVVLPLTGNYLGKEIAFHPSMIANTPWERAGLRSKLNMTSTELLYIFYPLLLCHSDKLSYYCLLLGKSPTPPCRRHI